MADFSLFRGVILLPYVGFVGVEGGCFVGPLNLVHRTCSVQDGADQAGVSLLKSFSLIAI